MAKAGTRGDLWGKETTKAVANFPVSGDPIPVPVARWLGRIKAAAALANAELGLLDEEQGAAHRRCCMRIANGELDDQFPIDVFQTGSGTSSNMNANEVIASLAGDDVHANDDVNMGQSSNDVFPLAVHLAAPRRARSRPAPRARDACSVARSEGARVRRRHQVGSNALDGTPSRHTRSGVRGICGAGAAGIARVRDAPPTSRPDSARRHRGRHGSQHAS